MINVLNRTRAGCAAQTEHKDKIQRPWCANVIKLLLFSEHWLVRISVPLVFPSDSLHRVQSNDLSEDATGVKAYIQNSYHRCVQMCAHLPVQPHLLSLFSRTKTTTTWTFSLWLLFYLNSKHLPSVFICDLQAYSRRWLYLQTRCCYSFFILWCCSYLSTIVDIKTLGNDSTSSKWLYFS